MREDKSSKQSITLVQIKDILQLIDSKQLDYRAHNQHRVRSLKKYMVNNVDANLFLPPLVLNKTISNGEMIYHVIDGNVRLRALHQLPQLIKEKEDSLNLEDIYVGEKLKAFIENGSIAVQLFESLPIDTMNQLYIDFNTKGKKVALSKLISYDSRNEINQITNMILQLNQDLQIAGVEMEKNAVIKPKNPNLLSLSQLRKLITLFLKSNLVSHVPNRPIESNIEKEQTVELIVQWFHQLFELHEPASIGDYKQTMLSSYPLLNAIAYYAIKETNDMSFEEMLREMEKRMIAIRSIDFSVHNPIWKTFEGRYHPKERVMLLKNSHQTIYSIVDWLEQQARKEVSAM